MSVRPSQHFERYLRESMDVQLALSVVSIAFSSPFITENAADRGCFESTISLSL